MSPDGHMTSSPETSLISSLASKLKKNLRNCGHIFSTVAVSLHHKDSGETTTSSISSIKNEYCGNMSDEAESSHAWRDVPDVILVNIIRYLTMDDRVNCSQVCERWSDLFSSPLLWRTVDFKLFKPHDLGQFRTVEKFGQHFKSVYILLDQFGKENRENACAILDFLATESPNLKRIGLKFRGTNPLFYAGGELISSLCRLFSSPVLKKNGHLTHVDLSGLNVGFDDMMMCELVNCPNLQVLNAKNRTLVSKVTPVSIMHVVAHCPKLCDLRIHYCSLNDEVLERLCSDREIPMKYISLFCTRADKYYKVLSTESWNKLIETHPGIRVGLHFDHTISVQRIWEILLPDIPVKELRLETYTTLNEELRFVTTNYSKTLERLSVQTPRMGDIDDVILNLTKHCKNLHTFYVLCVLNKETIDAVYENLPGLKKSGRFVLNHEKLPQPWIEAYDLEEAFLV